MLQRFGVLKADRFLKDTKGFADMLTDCLVVVSCSFALHLVFPQKTTNWTPLDRDIYDLNLRYISLQARIEALGYIILKEGKEDGAPCTFSKIHQVVTFSDSVCGLTSSYQDWLQLLRPFSVPQNDCHELCLPGSYILRLSA